MVDFHSHILPGIDDGSSSVGESLEMLRLIHAQGIRKVIATPHFYAEHDTPNRFLARRERAFRELEPALEGALPEILLGAEVHYFEGISDSEALDRLTIAGTNYLLLEMPVSLWSERMYRELDGMHQKRGIVPIIAHIDRYISPFRTFGISDRLAQLPVLVQANASFFLRRFTRPMALRMLRSGGIHLLGSDCHNLTSRRPNLGEAFEVIKNRLGDDALEEITCLETQVLESKLY